MHYYVKGEIGTRALRTPARIVHETLVMTRKKLLLEPPNKQHLPLLLPVNPDTVIISPALGVVKKTKKSLNIMAASRANSAILYANG